MSTLSTESQYRDADFVQRYLEKRATQPRTCAMFAVSESAGKAHATGMSEAHNMWHTVDQEVSRSRHKARKAAKEARWQASLQAGLPPGKQTQEQSMSYLELKKEEDERLAIARRLAVRIEQHRERERQLEDRNVRQVRMNQPGASATTDGMSKNVQLQEQDQGSCSAPASSVAADRSAEAQAINGRSGAVPNVLDSARGVIDSVRDAFAGAIKSFNRFREKEAPLPYAPRKLTHSQTHRGMSFGPSSLEKPEAIAAREEHDRLNFGGAAHAQISGGGSEGAAILGYHDAYHDSTEERSAIDSGSTARRVLAARGGARARHRPASAPQKALVDHSASSAPGEPLATLTAVTLTAVPTMAAAAKSNTPASAAASAPGDAPTLPYTRSRRLSRLSKESVASVATSTTSRHALDFVQSAVALGVPLACAEDDEVPTHSRRNSRDSIASTRSLPSQFEAHPRNHDQVSSVPLPPPSAEVRARAVSIAVGLMPNNLMPSNFEGMAPAIPQPSPACAPAGPYSHLRCTANDKMLPASSPGLILTTGHSRFEAERIERSWNTQTSFKAQDMRQDHADLNPAWVSRPRWKKPIGRTYRAPDRAPEHLMPENMLTDRNMKTGLPARDPRMRVIVEGSYIRLERPEWTPSQLPEPWC
jgi:hypothetical protein